jgi:hypothetical protein
VTFSSGDIDGTNILPSFVAYVQGSAISLNGSLISLVNTSAASLIYVYRIRLINVQNSAVPGAIVNFQMNRITGHSAGTLVTVNTYDTLDTLDDGVSVRTNGTVAGETTPSLRRVTWSSDEWGVGSPDVESNQHDTQLFADLFSPYDRMKPLVLRQNQGVHIKQVNNTAVGSFDVMIEFTQGAL